MRPAIPTAPGSAADHVRIAANAETTRSRIAALWGRALNARLRLDALSVTLLAEHAKHVEATREHASATRTATEDAARAQHDNDSDRLRRATQTAVSTLAPSSWAGDLTSAPGSGSGPARFCRIGNYLVGESSVPALHSLFDGPGWLVESEYSPAADLCKNVVLRSLAEVPLRHLTITVFDPRLRGTLGGLAPIRSSSPTTFPPPLQDAVRLVDRLDEVLADAARNAESVVAAGAASLKDKWSTSPPPTGRVHLIMVVDFPNGLDEPALNRLAALTSVDGSTGTVLMVHRQPRKQRQPSEQDSVPGAGRLLDQLTLLRWRDGGWSTPTGAGGMIIQPDPPPDPPTVAAILQRAADSIADYQGETIKLESLLSADLAEPWNWSAAQSLEAVIGLSDGKPVTISLRTENPPHPNLLLGGAVGQGKSNLMLDLIYALAVRYSPDELEFYLLDFKQGLEFKRFDADERGESWLPHVRALSLESNQEFGIAVLRHVDAEMTRRAAQFKSAGATSIDSFRAASDEPMPRLLLVIDEFHVLFDGEDSLVDEAVDLLERLARQGRAYGIHVLLGSQTVSGMRALATRGDAIFAQFPIRISLKNTAAESQAILSQGNSAAADLNYRGEVIINRNFGSDPSGSNVRALAAHADPVTFQGIQRQLWQRAHGARPLVFVGTEAAAWDRGDVVAHWPERGYESDLELWVGRPIAMTKDPYRLFLTDDVDQTIALVGPGVDLARAALEAALSTAILSLGEGAAIMVLDAIGEVATPWFARTADLAKSVGIGLHVVNREEIAAALMGPVLDALTSDPPGRGLVVALGLQRVRGMDTPAAKDDPMTEPDPYSMLSFEEPTPRSVLRRLAAEGALVGLPLIAWWPNIRSVEIDLGVGTPGVRAFVTADLGLEDLRSIAGPHARQPQGAPRLGIVDRLGSGMLDVIVPFGPLTSGDQP